LTNSYYFYKFKNIKDVFQNKIGNKTKVLEIVSRQIFF